MNPRLFGFLAGVVLTSLVYGGIALVVGSSRDGSDRTCTWEIGTMGALSGDYASIGVPIMRGIEYAVDEANRSGDLACHLELIKEDSQGDPATAAALAQKIVGHERLVACICPYFSGETLSSGQIFSDAGVLMASTASNVTIREQGFKTWFRVQPHDEVQGPAAAAYIEEGLDAEKVVVVHDNQDYSKGIAEIVLRELSGAKGPFIIDPEESDYSAVVAKIKAERPDIVFYGGYYPEAAGLAKQLHDHQVEARLFSDAGSKDAAYGDLAGATAEGTLVTCPCVDPREVKTARDFVRGFEARYGRAPGTLVSEMYDVATFVTKALERFDEDTPIRNVRRGIIRYFDRGVDLVGVTKAFTWTEDGELVTNPAQDVWIYEWNVKTDNFEAVGPVGALL